MTIAGMVWSKVKNNPIFVLAYSSFLGALAAQMQAAYSAGHLDFSLPVIKSMLGVAAVAAVMAVVHLYVTPPNSSPSVNTKTLAVLLALLLIPATTMAQSNGFSGASEAVAINYQGAWSAGTHVTESYDFMDFGSAKANHLYLQGHELLAPGPGVNIYAGGIQYEPDIHKLIAKTNVPAGSFVVYVQGAAGNGTPSVGKSHMSFIAGGGVQYHLAGALTWQALNAQWFRYGNTSGTAISTGLTFIFAK